MQKYFLFLFIMLFFTALPAQNLLIKSLKQQFDSVKVCENQTAAVLRQEPLYALFGKNGKPLTAFAYKQIYILSQNFIFVRKQEKFALMDSTGALLTDFLWEECDKKSFLITQNAVVVIKNKLYGVIDDKGKEILSMEYAQMQPCRYGGGIICQKERKFGLLNEKAQWALPMEYELIKNAEYMPAPIHSFNFPYLLVKKQNKIGLYDEKGKEILPIRFDEIELQGYSAKPNNLIGVQISDKKGYYDFTGKEIVPIIFPRNTFFSNYGKGYLQGFVGDTFYLYDTTKLLFKCNQYNYVWYLGESKLFKIGIRDSFEVEKTAAYAQYNSLNINTCSQNPPKKMKIGLMNEKGEVLIPPLYEDICCSGEGNAFAGVRKGNLWAAFSLDNQQLTSFEYERVIGVDKNFAIIRKNGREGIINHSGKVIIPLIYKNIRKFYTNKWIVTTEHDKLGVIDDQNRVLLPPVYDYMEGIDEDYACYEMGLPITVKQGQYSGLMDTALHFLIPCEYPKLDFTKGFYRSEDGKGNCVYYNVRGKKLKSFTKEEDNEASVEWGVILFYKKGLLGAIDISGKEVIPFKYKSYSYNYTENLFLMYEDETEKNVTAYNETFQVVPITSEEKAAEDSTIIKNIRVAYPNYTFEKAEKTGFFIVQKPDLVGVVYFSDPQIFIQYDEMIEDEDRDFIIVKKGKEEGLLSLNLEVIVPLQNKIHFFEDLYSNPSSLLNDRIYIVFQDIKTKKLGVFGIVEKKIIILPKYNAICEVENGIFAVRKAYKYGLMTKNKRLLAPFVYFSIRGDVISNYLVAYKDATHFQIMDKKGKVILKDFFEGIDAEIGFIELTKEEKKYYYNNSFHLITNKYLLLKESDCKDIYAYHDKVNVGYYMTLSDKRLTLKGLIDSLGNEILPEVYNELEWLSTEVLKVEKEGKIGVFSLKKGFIVPLEYEEIDFIQEKFFITKRDTTFGLFDLGGKNILPNKYQEIGKYPKEAIKAKLKDKWGIASFEEKIIIPFEYEAISEMINNCVVAQKGGKCGILSQNNTEILSFEYEGIEILSNTLFKIKKDCKYALINDKRKILSNWYENMTPLWNSFAEEWEYLEEGGVIVEKALSYFVVTQNDLKGLISSSGKEMIPCIYASLDRVEGSSSSLLAVKDKQYGLITTKNEVILPFIYKDGHWYWKEKFFKLKNAQDKYGIVDKKGKIILPFEFEEIFVSENEILTTKNAKVLRFDFQGKAKKGLH